MPTFEAYGIVVNPLNGIGAVSTALTASLVFNPFPHPKRLKAIRWKKTETLHLG